ncbi:serine/threonine-protein phosphatase with EF-hands 2 isoform X6 [Lepidochelys kempii]|uniref:serine/threonine-protein phosphatase with EF-hands 2 isoform X6 n=1 Tax=Lepidochelys kempii TaxID=8472 RepID=UPI003C6F14E7
MLFPLLACLILMILYLFATPQKRCSVIMGCSSSTNAYYFLRKSEKVQTLPDAAHPAFKAAVLIQRWYRRYVARLEMRRRCTWRIFQSIEYSCEQDQIKLHNFFSYLMDHFTPSSSKERDFISRMLTEEESYKDTELEKLCDYESVEVPDSYTGPHLSFPLLPDHATALLEAFKQKQEVHLNRGNHEDHMVNLRYGFTKEVMQKYKVHGKKILKMLQNVFCWLPLATIIDQKVLILHGGVSDVTDLVLLAKIPRHKFVSVLRGKKRKEKSRHMDSKAINGESPVGVDPPRSSSFLGSCLQSELASAASSASRAELSQWVRQMVQEELEKCRKQVGFDETPGDKELTCVSSVTMTKSELESCETSESSQEEWKQIVDILWSDPMPQEGCKMNTVRGGGCYFGPDVTEKILQKHSLQFLIRSHECKQEGYEFCHNRKVLTIFSASNYYEIGSNRGAYVKLGPDLIPHFVQYQANKTAHTLTMRQRISRVEESAFRALREKLFAHTSDLICAFKSYDQDGTGTITLSDWATAVESVLHFGLPWRMLRPQLVRGTAGGLLEYRSWLDDLTVEQRSKEHIQSSLLEAIYRNRSNLETIFRIIDSDHSGLISFEEFHQTWKLFSSPMNMELTADGISDLARSLDFNKDGNIDFNEFLEAFRLIEHTHGDDKAPHPAEMAVS